MPASKRIAVAFSGGLIAESVNRIIPIIILHFVAVRIGVEQFGFAQFGIQIMDLAIYFIIFGFHTIGAVQIGGAKDDPLRVGQIIAETTVLKLIFAGFAGLVLLTVIGTSPGYANFLPLILALSFILITTAIDLNYVHMGTQKMLALSLMTVLCKAISLVAIILLVAGPEDTILYAVLVLGANGLVSLMNWAYNLRRFIYRRFSWSDLVQRCRDAAPYAATVLLLIVMDRFDLFVVQHFGGTEEAGLYAAPTRLYFSIINVVSALGGVFFSELVALTDRRKFTRVVQLSFKAMLLMIVPAAAGVWFVDRELIRLIVGDAFVEGAPVLSVLLLGCVAHVAIVVFGLQVMQVRKQSRTLNLVLVVALILGVAMAIVFYQVGGMTGVAWALVGAKSFAAVVLTWFVRRHLEWIPWTELIKVGVPGLIMVAALSVLDSGRLGSNLLVGSAVFLVAVLVVNHGELKQLWQMLRAARAR